MYTTRNFVQELRSKCIYGEDLDLHIINLPVGLTIKKTLDTLAESEIPLYVDENNDFWKNLWGDMSVLTKAGQSLLTIDSEPMLGVHSIKLEQIALDYLTNDFK